MKRLNKNYDASKVVQMLAIEKENDPMIGKLVKFHVRPWQGTSHRQVFIIGGRQKLYDGQEAYRVFSIEYNDDFGRPARFEDVYEVHETKDN